MPLRQLRTALLFSGPVPGIIHQFKYNGMFALAEPLADLMVSQSPSWPGAVDLALSIPLHSERRRLRGYNQSELLARHLCRRLGLDTDLTALQRIRATRPQVELSPIERQANVAGAFWADGDRVANKEVLLIDDVCTTGSTLSEAATALLGVGANAVSGYCLARAL